MLKSQNRSLSFLCEQIVGKLSNHYLEWSIVLRSSALFVVDSYCGIAVIVALQWRIER